MLRFRNQHVDLGNVELETPRLHLRPISQDYSRQIFEAFTPEITQYMIPKSPDHISETEAFITEAIEARSNDTELHLVICHRDEEEFLGICGLHSRGDPSTPELGIWIKKSAHGHRYGQEAISALVTWVSGNIDCDGLIYPVDRRNVASRKIPETLGGRIIEEKEVENMSGRVLDEIVYLIPSVPVDGTL